MTFDPGTKFYIIQVSETKSVKVVVEAPNEDVARAFALDGRGRSLELTKRNSTTEILEELPEQKYWDLIHEINAWPNS